MSETLKISEVLRRLEARVRDNLGEAWLHDFEGAVLLKYVKDRDTETAALRRELEDAKATLVTYKYEANGHIAELERRLVERRDQLTEARAEASHWKRLHKDTGVLLAAAQAEVQRLRGALAKTKERYWELSYSGTGNVKSLSVQDFSREVEAALATPDSAKDMVLFEDKYVSPDDARFMREMNKPKDTAAVLGRVMDSLSNIAGYLESCDNKEQVCLDGSRDIRTAIALLDSLGVG